MTQDRDAWRSFVFGHNGPRPWDTMMMMMMMMMHGTALPLYIRAPVRGRRYKSIRSTAYVCRQIDDAAVACFDVGHRRKSVSWTTHCLPLLNQLTPRRAAPRPCGGGRQTEHSFSLALLRLLSPSRIYLRLSGGDLLAATLVRTSRTTLLTRRRCNHAHSRTSTAISALVVVKLVTVAHPSLAPPFTTYTCRLDAWIIIIFIHQINGRHEYKKCNKKSKLN